jgi:hypothetical protein
MKQNRLLLLGNLVILFLSTLILKINAQGTIEPFLGRWALYLPGGAGWLEVRQESGYFDADILWYGGSVVPVDNIYLQNETLVVTRNSKVVRKKDADGEPLRTHFVTSWIEVNKNGKDKLTGKATSPNRGGVGTTTVEFTAKRIPDLVPRPDLTKIKYGEAIELFNGKDLTGWQLIEADKANGFKVEDGALVNDPIQKKGDKHIRYGNLRTVDMFEDFNLKLQVNIPEGNNSGIYLRGIYEVQVYDSYKKPLDSHHMGAIYSRITPTIAAEKPPGEWQDFDITLYKRHVTVKLNGTTIIDNQPLFGVTGGALTADEFIPGPIYLQGDHGKVKYRNIMLTPIEN